jgi:hypothetical protein
MMKKKQVVKKRGGGMAKKRGGGMIKKNEIRWTYQPTQKNGNGRKG